MLAHTGHTLHTAPMTAHGGGRNRAARALSGGNLDAAALAAGLDEI
jgi:hypothetical protein